ncbi:tRNA-uridine aminocarboxypropyltransferase [Salinivibrio proteolyticus]|uniref:tRNA-uridine aminocarboxypropyltransferase n=1 Tax=Salinivibrio proteolyticus TaxID=334715 RepID=A0ABY7LC45_9GAMM|nr:DTW domain-containing protein [Salinivibrio proteolyticus]WBA14825.1 DTW domain-containing protein [Salinivibrio proteolyticus]
MARSPCRQCGFTYHCICHCYWPLESQLQCVLVMHENEAARQSNTGKLVKAALPHTQIEIWQRKQPPQALLDSWARGDVSPWLLFPSDDAVPADRLFADAVRSISCADRSVSRAPLQFVVLDATWQQARKMLNKSPWLHRLPRVSLPSTAASQYTLRRNQPPGHLCTSEAVSALLRSQGDVNAATQLDHFLVHFMESYEADRHHHTTPLPAPKVLTPNT